MQVLPPTIEVDPVHHLPILKASADHLGRVNLINHSVPMEMAVDAGTVVLGLVLDLDTRSGQSPLSRLGECFAPPDTTPLLDQAVPPQALNADPVGRVHDRLSDCGPPAALPGLGRPGCHTVWPGAPLCAL
jgi:hypothetical protein